MLVIGGRDMEAGAVSVRLHHGGPQGAKPMAEAVADNCASIRNARSIAPDDLLIGCSGDGAHKKVLSPAGTSH